MPHSPRLNSHLPVGDLIDLADRSDRPASRPEWLREFIDAAAELFDPIAGLGRVGFRTEPSEEGWVAAL
ncbi:MAG: hypothetical protein AAF907_04150, partial [Planctomycetota bacterium]